MVCKQLFSLCLGSWWWGVHWAVCGAPKCCVTCAGSVARLWSSLWRGHRHLCDKLGLCPIPVHPWGCPGSAPVLQMSEKAHSAGLQTPVAFLHVVLAPGITHPPNNRCVPQVRREVTRLGGAGARGRVLRGRGCAGDSCGSWPLPAPAGRVARALGPGAAAGLTQPGICWQISPVAAI